jgi:hypothetical protein
MTSNEFNEKYKNYLKEGHYGLSINNPTIVDFLDSIFKDLTKIPHFKYSQIKMKFGMARFYSTLTNDMNFLIEDKINQVYKILNDKSK